MTSEKGYSRLLHDNLCVAAHGLESAKRKYVISMKRWQRIVLTLGILAVGLISVLAVTARVYTEPFKDSQGSVLPNSVAVMEKHEIGGLPQMLWLRGANVDNPALILLHGGPGASEAALFRHYNNELEKHFLVVYWEQRGTGRSFSPSIPPDTMNTRQFVSDLDEVVALVKERFHKDKVLLLGHSWGTALGTLYAYEHPENVAAYIGIGQVANMPEGEKQSYDYALSEARRRNDTKAVRELERIGSPPHDVRAMLTSRRWVERFGGSFHSAMNTGDLILAALSTSEGSWWDILLFGRGNQFSLNRLWPEFRNFKLDETHLEFEVPVFFLEGRYDYQVPATVAETYFNKISAPHKELIWFENSAHNVPFEEPKEFNEVLMKVKDSSLGRVGSVF
jgi:proline iminopeptidase